MIERLRKITARDLDAEVRQEHGRGAQKGSRQSAEGLMSIFREHVNDIMPIEFVAEPGRRHTSRRARR